jgi:small basic protein (TIGR04137 family)
MSLHKSLSSGTRLKRQRSVLTRWERVLRLREEERWEEGRSVFALPKVKVVRHKKHRKPKKEAVAAAEGAAAVGVEGAEAAPPPEPKGKEKERGREKEKGREKR